MSESPERRSRVGKDIAIVVAILVLLLLLVELFLRPAQPARDVVFGDLGRTPPAQTNATNATLQSTAANLTNAAPPGASGTGGGTLNGAGGGTSGGSAGAGNQPANYFPGGAGGGVGGIGGAAGTGPGVGLTPIQSNDNLTPASQPTNDALSNSVAAALAAPPLTGLRQSSSSSPPPAGSMASTSQPSPTPTPAPQPLPTPGPQPQPSPPLTSTPTPTPQLTPAPTPTSPPQPLPPPAPQPLPAPPPQQLPAPGPPPQAPPVIASSTPPPPYTPPPAPEPEPDSKPSSAALLGTGKGDAGPGPGDHSATSTASLLGVDSTSGPPGPPDAPGTTAPPDNPEPPSTNPPPPEPPPPPPDKSGGGLAGLTNEAPPMAIPPAFDPGSGTNVSFVLDHSLSMKSNGKSARARTELLHTLELMGPAKTFYVLFFHSGGYEGMPGSGPLSATPENIASITNWLFGVGHKFGSDPTKGMSRALNMVPAPDTVWLLSDGRFSKSAVGVIHGLNTGINAHINTVALYSTNGEEAMSQIANENSGTYRFIPAPQ